MKALTTTGINALLSWQFVDFHAEAIIYLLWIGAKVEEYPIAMREREHGESMYSLFSHVWYPLSVLLMIAISFIQLSLYAKKGKKAAK